MPGLCLPPLAVRLSSGLFTTRAELVKQFGLIVERLRTNGAACGLLTHKYLPCTCIQPLISALMGAGGSSGHRRSQSLPSAPSAR